MRSPAERMTGVIIAGALLLFGGFFIARTARKALVDIPVRGGTITEGMVGSPRFINPLLASSDTDRDLTALVHAGLLRATPDGTLVPDLAKSFEISDDGLQYTFTLREDAVFHDGTPVGADDVVFTITNVQDGSTKSPKRANWEEVSVEQLDERRVRFTLPKPYTPFLENVTIGILPKHLWENVTSAEFPFSSLNIEPVGAGPYKIKTVKHSVSGIPLSYTLTGFSNAASGEPYIRTIILRFYTNEESLIAAFKQGEVESMSGISPEHLSRLEVPIMRIERTPLPRIFGVFFNQNQATILAELAVREALDAAIDKNKLIEEVLGGYGTPINSPLPPTKIAVNESPDSEDRTARAKEILENAGWKRNSETGIFEKGETATKELAFTLSTGDMPELIAAAESVKRQWELVGARIDLKILDVDDLTQNAIRPREYDALLFGEVVGRDMDLFAFWHSSQRIDPGLNIALYANIDADKLLEEARITDGNTRLEKYRLFAEEVRADMPAVFLYAPDFLYVVPERLKGLQLGAIATSEERFLSVADWFVETERVWPIFVKKAR